MRIQGNSISMYAMQAYSAKGDDAAVNFADELIDEMADEISKDADGLKPGESRDYAGILESQMALGLHKRDMFLTVNATERSAESLLENQILK